ncbi:MAG: TonB-dependent receptor [Alphaproteobacteria bacterium]|nr:TonB-dependent receptor [Alphaproteobacteria bacterium]MDE2110775.1 TonB-dependent receptor [Alphaproteobacteria bacterium]MDE2494580.1 TonB-dependent receptor [Alphaproteobacteria bacterium]
MGTKWSIAAVLTVMLAAPPALADSVQTGILTYPASFFADAKLNTAYDMIQRLPGFTFDDGKTARGFAGTAGNVLVDGLRPTAKTDDLQSILQRIPASDVDHIEVIRGGAPGIDMHGQTVIANVVRKKSDSTQIVADVEDNFWPDGHSVPYASLDFTQHSGDSTYEASLSRLGNFDDSVGKGFYNVTDVATGTVQHTPVRTTGSGAGWGLTSSASIPLYGGQFKANLTYQDAPFHGVNIYTAPGNSWTIGDDSGEQDGELGLHWIDKLASSWELESLILQRFGRQTDLNTSNAIGADQYFALKNKTGESIVRAILRYSPNADLTVASGAEVAYNFLDGTSSYVLNGVPVPLPSANAHVNEKRGEAFTQATWKFAPDWLLEAGVRVEYSTISESGDMSMSRSFFFPKPRVLLTWAPNKNTQLRLRYERVVGQLDFTNFVASSNLASSGVNAGNPDLKPDRHTQYEASYEYDFWGKGAFVATLLHEDIVDVVDYVPVTGPSGVFDAPGNIKSGHNNQIDTEMTLPLDKVGLQNGLLKVTNIWRFDKVQYPVTGEPRAIYKERPQDIELTLTQDIDSLNSTWSIYYFNCWDEYYYRVAEFRHRRVTPPYVELSWEYKPTPAWSILAAVKNALPFGYDDLRDEYAGPRDSAPLTQIDELKIKSQPRFYIQIRKTFD